MVQHAELGAAPRTRREARQAVTSRAAPAVRDVLPPTRRELSTTRAQGRAAAPSRLPTGRRGAARRRGPARGRVPRRPRPLLGRVRRGRRVLRDLRLPHHQPARRRGAGDREHLARRFLRPARPPDPAGRLPRARRRRGRRRRPAARPGPPRARGRRPRLGALRGQLALRRALDGLLRDAGQQPRAALLVAQPGGAVLPAVAGARPAGRGAAPGRAAGAAPGAPGHRPAAVGGARLRRARVPRGQRGDDGVGGPVGLLRHPHPGVGAGRRCRGGALPAPPAPLDGGAGGGGGLGGPRRRAGLGGGLRRRHAGAGRRDDGARRRGDGDRGRRRTHAARCGGAARPGPAGGPRHALVQLVPVALAVPAAGPADLEPAGRRRPAAGGHPGLGPAGRGDPRARPGRADLPVRGGARPQRAHPGGRRCAARCRAPPCSSEQRCSSPPSPCRIRSPASRSSPCGRPPSRRPPRA